MPSLFFLEASEFSEELWGVVMPLFDEGQRAMANWDAKHKEMLREMLSRAKDQYEEMDANTLASWEEDKVDKRNWAIDAAVLHCTYEILKERLRTIARWFDKSHPSKGQCPGRSELHRISAEYKDRFGVRFEDSGHFSSVEELALARNAGIHSDLHEYVKSVKSPCFITEDGFKVDRNNLEDMLKETEQFVQWLVQEMDKVRKQVRKNQQ